MELIYGCTAADGLDRGEGAADIKRRWLQESSRAGLSSVSRRNVLLFSTTDPHPAATSSLRDRAADRDGPFSRFLHRVFVCDLNTPWDLHLVTARSSEITTLTWDESGTCFALADSDGWIELWNSSQNLLSRWTCVAKEKMPKETFLASKFVFKGKTVHLHAEKRESVSYSDKFSISAGPKVGSAFGHRKMPSCVFVSSSSLAVLLTYFPLENKTQVVSKSITGIRCNIKLAALTHMSDGQLVAATSSGSANDEICCFSLKPNLSIDGKASLEVEDFPPVFLQTQATTGNGTSEEVQCLEFVREFGGDSLLVACKHNSGGRVQLWELRTQWQTCHKLFSNTEFKSQTWHYVESFVGPAASVLSMATPPSSLQPGTDAPCYVAAAYADGSIQFLLRDSLQQVGSVDVPVPSADTERSPPAKKRARAAPVPPPLVRSLCFAATGNVLVAVDAAGSVFAYRSSPISDPGGPYTVAFLTTMLEYCMVSGCDSWDVSVCANRSNHVEAVCEKLAQNFEQQSPALRTFYEARYTSLMLALYRLVPGGDVCASDFMIRLLLKSVCGACRTLLRTSESCSSIAEKDKITYDKVSELLKRNKDETEVDNFVKMLQQSASAQRDLLLDSAALQSIKHLLQWSANLALSLMTSVPDFKAGRKAPGFGLYRDGDFLSSLRQLLLLIRVWCAPHSSCRPIFTRMAESVDVVARLFSLVTRLKESGGGPDEALYDDCLRLSSQVLVQPLNVHIRARGVAPAVVAAAGSAGHVGPGAGGRQSAMPRRGLHFQFGVEPDRGGGAGGGGGVDGDPSASVLVEGSLSVAQTVDCVMQMYMGKSPQVANQCTRCHSLTLQPAKNNSLRGWDRRWARCCPCGGNWKTKFFD